MKFIRNNIPNAITCLNLYLGVLGIYFAFSGALAVAAFFVVGGAVADFFDGMTARLLKSETKIGKDLDSLADLVTFGVAPVFIYINLPQFDPESIPYIHDIAFQRMVIMEAQGFMIQDILAYVPFLIVVFSAIRLAIFNNDTRQTSSFIGLPTPANGLMIASFALIAHYQPHYFPDFIVNPWFMAGFSILSCFLLVMPLPLFALKFKQWGFKGNEVRYIFLGLAVILMAVLQFAAIPLIIFLYILISLIQNFAKKPTI